MAKDMFNKSGAAAIVSLDFHFEVNIHSSCSWYVEDPLRTQIEILKSHHTFAKCMAGATGALRVCLHGWVPDKLG